MYQRALEGYEKAWGPDHISTVLVRTNLESLQMANLEVFTAASLLY